MKHNLKITVILILLFLITQIIGLFVVNFYQSSQIPYGMEPPSDINPQTSIISILFAFALAITLFFILTRINAEKFIRLWFFAVTVIAIGLTINFVIISILKNPPNPYEYLSIIALILAIPLAYFKIFRKNILIHNFTELLIYPGIAAVFVPILNVLGIILLLLAISLYDIWAVWHSKFMQNMAKYQIDKLKFFTGFFIPYAGSEMKNKIKLLKQKYKNKSGRVREAAFAKAKIKINLAILGGGDIVFPIITAGVFFKYAGLIPALIITVSATIGLLFLFILARKGKFYPAMPFLTIAMYLGMMLSWLIF
ncbi:MAG: presenilin family intramembrane aspartyl protease [Candidatus Nanoarchaeia archaeon]|nr:presenilin family intramembrane aspartyl protease [Candidatus Nanoarchaeia archaeon]MDD5741273.1 presenilin family intramembrane aspartyl protease [Candidatus Nanoarchaeia archaeon]